MGDVQGSPTGANLGDVAGALASYRKAEQIRKAIVAHAPDDAAARERLGTSAVKIADALIGRGDVKAAVAQYQTVRAVREDALRLSPASLSIRAGLAEVTGRLCSTLVAVGDVPGALQNCARNGELLRGLLQAAPAAPTAGTWSTQLVLNGIATGNAQRLSGDAKAAEATLRTTVASLDAMIAGRPNGAAPNADLGRRLAIAHAYRANAQVDLGDLRGASESYGGAVDRLSRLAALDPANTRFRTDLVYMLTKRGELLVKSGDTATARQVTSRALALQRESALAAGAPPDVLNDYAWALVTCQPEDLRQPAVALSFATRAVAAASESESRPPAHARLGPLPDGRRQGRGRRCRTGAAGNDQPRRPGPRWACAGRLKPTSPRSAPPLLRRHADGVSCFHGPDRLPRCRGSPAAPLRRVRQAPRSGRSGPCPGSRRRAHRLDWRPAG